MQEPKHLGFIAANQDTKRVHFAATHARDDLGIVGFVKARPGVGRHVRYYN
jgi:hypothetical protein